MDHGFEDLKNKEVINSENGHRLGCVSEVILDAGDERLLGLCLPYQAESQLRPRARIIPWACIEHIGKDLILVTLKEDSADATT